jgi:hypothetical protein
MNQTTNTTASIDLAQLDKLPRWIDNQKGNDPLMDDMIHYIEQLLARRSLTSGALAAKKNEAGFYPCPVPACGSDLVGTGRLPCGVDTVCCGRCGLSVPATDEVSAGERWNNLATPVHDAAAPSAEQAQLIATIRDRAARIRYIDESSRKLLIQAADTIEHLSAGAAAKSEQAPGGAAIANTINSIERDDDGPETPGIWTREEVLGMLKYEIVTDSGAATLRNGDELKFNLTDLTLLANRAAHLTQSSSAAGAGSEQAEPVAWMKPNEITGLIAAAKVHGPAKLVPVRNYGRVYDRQYDADMVPVVRAAPTSPSAGELAPAANADGLRPVEPGALAASIAELDAWLETDGCEPMTVSQGESVGLVLQELKRLRAVCPECKGTGMADSGGVHPWGEPAMIPCGCDRAPATSAGEVPAGWKLERVGDAIHITSPGGRWCGYMQEVDSPAHKLTHEFLDAVLAGRTAAVGAGELADERVLPSPLKYGTGLLADYVSGYNQALTDARAALAQQGNAAGDADDAARYRFLRDQVFVEIELPHYFGRIDDGEIDEAMDAKGADNQGGEA